MLNLSCHCGQIRIAISRKPDFVNECNCTLCAKSGARWGYFDPSVVSVEGATSRYCRRDKADPSAELHFCPTCGVTTHYRMTASAVVKYGDVMMGANLRLADEAELAGIELRYPDGRAWAGEGDFGQVRAPRIIGTS